MAHGVQDQNVMGYILYPQKKPDDGYSPYAF
jgi:hypothetical protein